MHRLEGGEHSEHLPYGWRAEDVYEMMGVPTSRAESFQDNVIAEFERLDKRKIKGGLSQAEAARLRHLRSEKRLPSDDPTRVGIELQNMIDSLKTKT